MICFVSEMEQPRPDPDYHESNVIIPGGRDKEGRPIIFVSGSQEITRSGTSLFLHLPSIFRYDKIIDYIVKKKTEET